MVSRFMRSSLRISPLALVAAAALVSGVSLAEAQKKPLQDLPLLLSFAAPSAIQSDGQHAPAPYDAHDYADGLENVRSYLFPSGNLSFNTQADTRRTATRTVCFGLATSFPAAGCWTLQAQVMTLIDNGDMANIQSLAVGQSVRRLTRFDWKVGTDTYRLGYGTDMDGDDEQDAPGVIVTCTAAGATGKCATWTVTPETDGTAALYRAPQVVVRGKTTVGPNEFIGVYVMPFVQTLSAK